MNGVLETMRLESVNVGRLERITHGKKRFATGICKRPVSGPVFLGEMGAHDDVIADLEYHGGPDQAVYAYSTDDYDWWNAQASREFTPGLFGENLTIRGLPTNTNIGDRLLIGEVLLEATSPRIPCSTLATRMQDSGFGLAFRKAERPGIYLRVLNQGHVRAGDTVTLVANDNANVSILDLFRFSYKNKYDPEELRRFLEAPIAERFRTTIESKLEHLERALD